MSLNTLLGSKTLGILCAMPEEVEEYLKNLEEAKEVLVSGVKYYQGRLQGKTVLVAQCGVGKVHCASAAQTMILKFDVGLILFSGVAGALNPGLEVGDLVISSEAVQHDMNLEPLGFPPGQIPWTPWRFFSCPTEVVAWAKGCAEELSYPHIVGRVLSGDQFVADPAKVEELKKVFAGDCVEMEAGALGQVCALNGDLPWMTIRAISDKADHSSPVDFPTFCQEAAKKSYRLVHQMLSKV